MPMYACQLWSKYTQASMKRLRMAYNDTYRIMHYIPRNVSVHPHQVNYYVKICDTLCRNYLYSFVRRCETSNFLFDDFKGLIRAGLKGRGPRGNFYWRAPMT